MPAASTSPVAGETHPASRLAHIETLCRILSDQAETCNQLADCAQEQIDALRQGMGASFVRSSLTQAHLARRLFFLEEERSGAVESLAQALTSGHAPTDLASLLERLPEADSERLAARSREVQRIAEKASSVQKVSAQMVQTNIQLAAALTRHLVDPTERYYGGTPGSQSIPASRLDQRI